MKRLIQNKIHGGRGWLSPHETMVGKSISQCLDPIRTSEEGRFEPQYGRKMIEFINFIIPDDAVLSGNRGFENNPELGS